MHWADAFTKDLYPGDQIISTGISPSGPIHVGNMREILTGAFIFQAAEDAGMKSELLYLCDDMDPLRKVYPFLDQSYSRYVGMPLYRIPAPDGNGSYSDYFLRPFIETLDIINVHPRVIRSSELYRDGILMKAIDIALNNSERIARILREISGRELEPSWAPYNAICASCGRINTTTMVSYKYPYVEYTCKCGYSGTADIGRDQGKLPWRIEWPAKWYALSVTAEPFGKDHGAPGGSYDTGKEIATLIYRINPPKPLVYERIMLKGKGAMHSSTGIAIPARELVESAPPELLRFLIARIQPARHIDFDPGLGILNLADEYEKYREVYFGKEKSNNPDASRIYELSRVGPENEAEFISFRHLITLLQIYPEESTLRDALKRSGIDTDKIGASFHKMVNTARNWLQNYAPEEVKFNVLKETSPIVLNEGEKKLLEEFLSKLDGASWDADTLHNLLHEAIKSRNYDPKYGFALFYRVLIGKEKGPRLGYFLSHLDKNMIVARIKFAISQ